MKNVQVYQLSRTAYRVLERGRNYTVVDAVVRVELLGRRVCRVLRGLITAHLPGGRARNVRAHFILGLATLQERLARAVSSIASAVVPEHFCFRLRAGVLGLDFALAW